MSALPRFAEPPVRAALVVLGSGVVGSALLARFATADTRDLKLVGVANSRRQRIDRDGLAADALVDSLAARGSVRDDRALLDALATCEAARRIVVDATASSEVAARHREWIARGFDVVTANKDAAAGCGRAWADLEARRSASRTIYGDAATVGAGLPALATLRRLRRCGDRLVAFEGVLSGSLSWLFNQYDGSRPFSALLREARAFGYCEPDPRRDLSGADVARKLVILARAAGHAIELGDVEVENLVPERLRGVGVVAFLDAAEDLDATIEARRVAAASHGCVLRHLATIDAAGRARVGLIEAAPSHPAAALRGTDNLFALGTERYRARPLVIQGPGAGAEVTAQALFGDILAIAGAEPAF